MFDFYNIYNILLLIYFIVYYIVNKQYLTIIFINIKLKANYCRKILESIFFIIINLII